MPIPHFQSLLPTAFVLSPACLELTEAHQLIHAPGKITLNLLNAQSLLSCLKSLLFSDPDSLLIQRLINDSKLPFSEDTFALSVVFWRHYPMNQQKDKDIGVILEEIDLVVGVCGESSLLYVKVGQICSLLCPLGVSIPSAH